LGERRGSPIPKIGYHGRKAFELRFDSVRVPAFDASERCETERGSGFVGARQGLKAARPVGAVRSTFKAAL